MTTETKVEAVAPLRVVAVVSSNGNGELLVLNRPLAFRYRMEGRDYIGQDGPFRDLLVYSPGSGRLKAFAGRELTLTMENGEAVKVKDHWWHSHIAGMASVARSDIDSLKKCYVYYGGACISHDDLRELRSAYTGCVYPYWDYEKVIKFDDLRRDMWRRVWHQENRCKSLIREVRAKHAELSAITALGAWVVPVGYQETITVQDDGVFADIEQKLWHWIPGKPIPESTADTFREPIYTLRQEKPE